MSAAEIALRPMRWWHLRGVAELEQEIFPATAWSLEQFYAELANPERWLRVLLDDDRVAGYVDVGVLGRDADLMTIAVSPQNRGQGLGARMLTAAMRSAAASGAHHMFLEVASNNPAQNMYSRRGFVTIDRRPNYYTDGSEALIMRATLHGDDMSGAGVDA